MWKTEKCPILHIRSKYGAEFGICHCDFLSLKDICGCENQTLKSVGLSLQQLLHQGNSVDLSEVALDLCSGNSKQNYPQRTASHLLQKILRIGH